MPGAEICNQLGSLGVGNRLAEGRHLLAAVQNLMGYAGWGPLFVLVKTSERRPFFAADAASAVTVVAATAVEEKRTGLFGGLVLFAEERGGRRRHRKEGNQHAHEGKLQASRHEGDSLTGYGVCSSTFGMAMGSARSG